MTTKTEKSKVNRALFKVLRDRVQATSRHYTDAERLEAEQAYQREVEAVFKGATKQVLIDYALGKVQLLKGVKSAYDRLNQLNAERIAQRQALIAKIDDAELEFLAGDDTAAKNLVAEITKALA